MQRLISRVELARLARVSKPAVTKFLGKHKDACVRDRVNVDHPAVQAWLKSKGVKVPVESAALAGAVAQPVAPKQFRKAAKTDAAPTTPAPATQKRGSKQAAAEPSLPPEPPRRERRRRGAADLPEQPEGAGSDEDLTRLARTLRPVLARFGTERNFKDWLDALKVIEDIRQKRNNNDEQEGRLIERVLVKTHVFGAIDGSHRRLLGDFPKTITRVLYAAHASGQSIEESEAAVREKVSMLLKSVKATAKRVLDDGQPGPADES